MRLIDADELQLALIERRREAPDADELWVYGMNTASHVVERQPTVIESLVRCHECKYWGTGAMCESDELKCCQLAKYMIGKNGYCLYGRRNDNG